MDEGHVLVDAVEETCVLVGIITSTVTDEQAHEYLDELEFLAETAGATSVKRFTQKLPMANPRTFVGTGKLEEIKEYVKENGVELVIFDDELSPSQLRNIERELECKILDRNILILDIFASRARTSHAKTQVELAQMQYMLPRLKRLWTHLERQKGGIGLRGPGESQIETDRRIIQTRIALLKEKLKEIDKQMSVQRGNRGQLVRVALVGYTNVGKSTMMNMLSKSEVFAENKLFATLDTTVRKVVIENLPFLLTDTVGFIRKLPHQLVESFKSTLDEVREADLLIHVVDISHPNFEDQLNIVNETLAELDNKDKPMILVFNKIDAYKHNPGIDSDGNLEEESANMTLEELKRTWMNRLPATKCVFISATDKDNVEELKETMYSEIKRIFAVRYPHNNFLY
ncbi:GTPase HflX [Fluviicola taffensis]|uniref:GTPase HflX n=1 Tax=Fluviicola taffensis (strain DSM 16823 / NCIMB 13979 / RW262) TaxID=755732 RepID=F2IK10_FLUTR|nr:GTPase HflX [Fluviicola taffensis]AEA42909.1 GTP-binding protein HflX [Fluviicola taffensis DSM 16823]